MREIAASRLKSLEKRRRQYQKYVDAAPEGKFRIAYDREWTKWYVHHKNGTLEYVPKKKKEYAIKMARKRYYEELVKEIDKETYAINLYLKHSVTPKKTAVLMNKRMRYAEIIGLGRSAIQWAKMPFETNPYMPERLIHDCPAGHKVRSKSELYIATRLYERGIPYRYECLLVLNEENKYPDFTFYKPSTGEYRYWEHFGIVEDIGYCDKMGKTLHLYGKNGIIGGKNLYMTFETMESGISYYEIEKIIDEIEKWLNS